MTVRVTTKGLQKFQKAINKDIVRQLPFIMSKALNDIAKDAVPTANASLSRQIDRPTSFSTKPFRFTRATKRDLVATLTLKDIQAGYLERPFIGGISRPRNRFFAIGGPGSRPNRFGNYPSKRRIGQLLRDPNVFIAEIKGINGIWKRIRRGKKVRLLFRFETDTQYQSTISLRRIGNNVLTGTRRRGRVIFGRVLSKAIGTSRIFK